MADSDSATDADIPHPRVTSRLFGHAAAQQALLDAYRSQRMPHAWLIGGQPGIGKATLAYRLAKFVLAYPDPTAHAVQAAHDLAIADDHPVTRQVAFGTHGGLLSLERQADDKGKVRSTIVVDQVRETVPFFGATAEAGGWRICVVDSVDELKSPEAPNALLKILEEPPARSIFLLISHAPGRVLPTIRSRCRLISLRPLSEDDTVQAAALASGRDPGDADLAAAVQAAEGSPARALMLLAGDALGLSGRVGDLLARLPQLDDLALHQLADSMGPADRVALQVFAERIDHWLSARLQAQAASGPRQLARLSQVWEKISHSVRETEIYNLERKPLVFSVFSLLRDVA